MGEEVRPGSPAPPQLLPSPLLSQGIDLRGGSAAGKLPRIFHVGGGIFLAPPSQIAAGLLVPGKTNQTDGVNDCPATVSGESDFH